MNIKFSNTWLRALTRKVVACGSVVVAALVITSCAEDDQSGTVIVNDDQAEVAFRAPAMLVQSRMIVEENLILRITIGDRDPVTVLPDENGNFILSTTVPANTSTDVTAEWFEDISGTRLLLAIATKELNVGSASSPATLLFDAYKMEPSQSDIDSGDFSLDNDRDGRSNFDERQNGTEFFNASDPPSPPVTVTLNVSFFLPAQLENSSDEIRLPVSAQGFVNEEEILLTRVDDVWSGMAIVNQDTSPLIEVRFFATAEQSLQFAQFAFNQNVGSGIDVVVQSNDYRVSSFDFDSDEDGLLNVEEIAAGTDPLNPDDPDTNIAPVADAGPNQTIQAGEALLVDGSGSSDSDGTIDSFVWSEGATELATGETTTISNLSVGTHVIELEVTDNGGGTDTDSLVVTVTAVDVAVTNESPMADAGSNQNIVEGETLLVDGAGSSDDDGTIASYQWLEEGVELATGETASIPGLAAGTHTIDLLVTDNDGATDTDSITVTVTVVQVGNQPPVADAGNDQTIEEGETADVDGSGSADSDGTIEFYQWLDENGAVIAVGVMPSIPNLEVGDNEIDLLVTDDDGETGRDSITVTVTAAEVINQAPEAEAGADQTIVEGDDLVVNGSGSQDTDGDIVDFSWQEDDEVLAEGEIATIMNLEVGTHVIQLTVTDDDGGSDSDTLTVTVDPATVIEEPSETNVPPVADAGEDQFIEEGETLELDGSGSEDPDPDGTIESYQWLLDGNVIAIGEITSFEGLEEGVFQIDLDVTDNDGAIDRDSFTVTVTAP